MEQSLLCPPYWVLQLPGLPTFLYLPPTWRFGILPCSAASGFASLLPALGYQVETGLT